MKVCFISTAKSIHTQRWVSSLAKAGCEIHLISSSKANISGVQSHQVSIASNDPFGQVWNILRIRSLIRRLKPDIIHLFGLFSVNSLRNILHIKSWPNLVVSILGSDLIPFDKKETVKEKFTKRYLLKRGQCILVTSEYLAQEVRKYMEVGEKIVVIPWGVEIEKFIPSNKTNNNCITLGFAKRIERISGPDILLESFREVLERTEIDLHLRIAGDGSMKSPLIDYTKKYGFNDRIGWLGWLYNREEIIDFYRSIDIFIMPSRRESFGVAALEAAASGLPVIASRFGGIPETVIHGETGLLIEPEDVKGFSGAITHLAKNEHLRKEMGFKGRMRVEANFDWRNSISNMINIYKKISRG